MVPEIESHELYVIQLFLHLPVCMPCVCVWWCGPEILWNILLLLLLHRFNGLFSRTTWVSRYHKGKISVDLSETRDDGALGCSGLDDMQTIRTSLQTDNHINTSKKSLNFYRPDALPDAQPTVSKHWRHFLWNIYTRNFFCIVVVAYAVEFWIRVVRQRWRCSKGHQWEGLYSLCTAELFGT